MPDLARELSRGLAEIQQLYEESEEGLPTFTWNGSEIVCTPGKVILENMFGAGGLTPDHSLRLDVEESALPAIPPLGAYITYDSRTWRIDKIEKSAGVVSLFANDPNRTAGVLERSM